MINIEIILVLVAVSYNIHPEAYAISVWKCPCSKEKWEERARDFNCNEKTYTCILNKDGKLMETCIFPYTFDRDDVGCPFVQQVMPDLGALIGIKHTTCNVTGCPLRGHDRYGIDEMYKYPVCWIPEKDRDSIHLDLSTVCESKVDLTTTPVPNDDDIPVTLIAVLFALILMAGIVAVLFMVFLRRRQCLKGNLESGCSPQEYTNYATGLAWSHYTGYLRTLLPALKKAIEGSETFKAHPERTKLTWVMLCPRSAKSTDLTNVHSIRLAEVIQIPDTYFKVNMYEIKLQESGESWFCCMEYPSALMSLGNQSYILSPEKVSLEVERFSYYIMNILNHEGNTECKDKAITLLYDGSVESLKRKLASSALNNKKGELQEKNDVSICLLKTRRFDRALEKTYNELEKLLSKNKDTFTANLISDDQRIVTKALMKAEWIVIYGINHAIPSSYPWLLQVLAQLVEDGKCKIVCLFSGRIEERTTKHIPSTVLIDMEKVENMVAQVNSIVMGLSQVSSSDIAFGDVSFGLAWSFYVNYLQHVLPDLHQRLESAVEIEGKKKNLNKQSIRVSRCLWQIVPSSCTFMDLDKFDQNVVGPIKVEPLQKNVHETKRVYQANLYYFQAGLTTYFFLGEVFSPCKVLRAMKESRFTHLTDKQFNHLRGGMIDQMISVLKTFENKYGEGIKTNLVEFKDGGSQSLSEMLKSLIHNEETSVEGEPVDTENIRLLDSN